MSLLRRKNTTVSQKIPCQKAETINQLTSCQRIAPAPSLPQNSSGERQCSYSRAGNARHGSHGCKEGKNEKVTARDG